MGTELSPHEKWKHEITQAIAEQLEVDHSDADGIVMVQPFAVDQSWGLGLSAADAAAKVITASQVPAKGAPATKSLLDVLRSYPESATVAELYDVDSTFSNALTSIFGEAFEYPDFSYKKVSEVVRMGQSVLTKQSRVEAENIARQKAMFCTPSLVNDQTLVGRVLGVTEFHVILSMGRSSAAILTQSDLNRVPAKDEEVTITSKDGKAHVTDAVQISGIGR